MLMMREAKSKNQCKCANAKKYRRGTGKAEDAKSQSRQNPHKPAQSHKSQNATAEEELGMQRMREAKTRKPPKAA